MPNNRQWAFIFWIAVLLVWIVLRRDTRSSVRDVLRTAASPKILVPVAVLVLWVVGLVFLASKVGLWDTARVTDTVFWFVTAGLILFGRFVDVSRERHFVRRMAFATLELSALVQVLSEVIVLELVAELILQPFFALLGGVSVVAAQKEEHRQVKRLVDHLILVGSVALLLYVVVGLANNWGSLDKGDLLQQFALPVWLTVGVLPYIYVLGLFSAYELAFIRIDWKSQAGWWARTSLDCSSGDIAARSAGNWRLATATISGSSMRDAADQESVLLAGVGAPR